MARELTYRLNGEHQDRRKEVDKKVVLSAKKYLTSVEFFGIMSTSKERRDRDNEEHEQQSL